MGRRVAVLLVWLFLVSLGAGVCAQTTEEIKTHPSCKYCGMDRQVFAHSRMLIEYEDGTTMGTCSITCVEEDMAQNKGKSVKSLWVGDYNSKELINAWNAFWVMGGSKSGVMTRTAKWAFQKQEDAQGFVNQYGGRIVTYHEVMKATKEENKPHGKKESHKKKKK